MEEKLISKEVMSLKIDTSPMEKRQIVFSADAPDKTELVLGDNFEIKVEDGKTFVVRKKPQYPKTYKECCEVLGLGSYFEPEIRNATTKECNEIMNFMRLKRCRDAYWKIAGEQMGLGKPWEPDWKDDSDKYFICYLKDELWMSNIKDCNRFLVFPTAEMRDAFKENFDTDLETCKELL